MTAAAMTDALPTQPLERGLVIARAALVAERAAAVVDALEVEALAAGRNLRLAARTLTRGTEWVAMLRDSGRLTRVEVMALYRVAARVTAAEADALAIANRLNTAEAELTRANRWMVLLRTAQDADESSDDIFPGGFEIYDGYLHYYGVCTGVMAD